MIAVGPMNQLSIGGEIMAAVAQLVRAPGCGPGGRGFESLQPPFWVGLLGLAPAFLASDQSNPHSGQTGPGEGPFV